MPGFAAKPYQRLRDHWRELSQEERSSQSQPLVGECSSTSGDSDASSADEGGPDDPECKWLQEVCNSDAWQAVVMSAIGLNTMCMAIECDTGSWRGWRPINDAFLLFFCVELVVRLIAFRCAFFTDEKDRYWNLFDFLVVSVGVLDQWISPFVFPQRNSNKGFVILRILRILRVFRSVRLIRHFPQLRLLIEGFIDAIQAAGWIFVFFFFLILVSGALVTIMVGHNEEVDWEVDCPCDDDECGTCKEEIERNFGTLLKSMFTLFRFVTLDDWSQTAQLVMTKIPWMAWFFLFYQFVTAFTVIQLLTGVIADEIVEAGSRQDREKENVEFGIKVDALGEYFASGKGGNYVIPLRSLAPGREARTWLSEPVAAGDDRILLNSLRGFVPGQAIRVVGAGNAETRTIVRCKPRTRLVVLDYRLDHSYQRGAEIEAIHPLVQAIMKMGLTDGEVLTILKSFDYDHDGILNYSEYSRGMRLYVNSSVPARRLDSRIMLTEVRLMLEELRRAETPAYKEWKQLEPSLEMRLTHMERQLNNITQTRLIPHSGESRECSSIEGDT